MKLLCIFAAFLAVSLAESESQKYYEDSEAAETLELQKEARDLNAEASAYSSYGQNSQRAWIQPAQNFPTQNFPAQNYPTQNFPAQNYPTQNFPVWNPPKNVPSATPAPVQSDYPAHHWHPQTYPPTWSTPHHVPTTTPISVIKNEQTYGDNGSYKYEYQIADGTHVGEEGYFTDPKGTDESIVKKGWYSYQGPDGKTYTVTYWADKTGFHAYGDHLPTPPPVPPAIQAALDQNAKEEAAQAAAYPTGQNTGYYTTQKPAYYPTTQKPTYYPQPPQDVPYYPPQQTYYPPQQTHYPHQQQYYPNQQAGK